MEDKGKLCMSQIVDRLIGDILPIGDSYSDEKAMDNLKAYTELFLIMLDRIMLVADRKEDNRYSVQECGEIAHQFLINYVKAEIDDYVECNMLNQ